MWVLVGGGVVQAVVARRRVRVRVFVFIGGARFVVIWGNCSSSGGGGVWGGIFPLSPTLSREGRGSLFVHIRNVSVCAALVPPGEREFMRAGARHSCIKNPGAWPGFLLGGWAVSLPRPVRCGTCASRRRLRSSRPGTRSSGRRGRRVPGGAS